jgi:predicted nucleotidyltransferase
MERQQVIDHIKKIGLKTLPPNSQLLLFGSRARGDAHKGSDWDLLILLDKPQISLDDYDVSYPFRELGWDLGEEINPQVYSKKEWSEYHFTPFYKNVEHDKLVLL